jgi:hypothetical protein
VNRIRILFIASLPYGALNGDARARPYNDKTRLRASYYDSKEVFPLQAVPSSATTNVYAIDTITNTVTSAVYSNVPLHPLETWH